ncbi:MAG: GNAT family N-acetyltransferase [Dongiaceae bacterium]
MSGIRPVGPFDLELLAALHAACFDDAWSARSIGAMLATPGAFGLLAGAGDGAADEGPAGFILLRAAADEAEILSLAVLPAARRRGVGRQLLAEAIDRLVEAGVRRLVLEVAENNAAARGLYAGAGFAEVGRRPGYYRQGPRLVAALIMARNLDSAG